MDSSSIQSGKGDGRKGDGNENIDSNKAETRDAVEDTETKKDAETVDAVSTSTIPLRKGKWIKMAVSKPDKPMI